MSTSRDETSLFRGLEEELLQPEVRADRARVAALLADGFIEIGSSGHVLGRPRIIEALEAERGEGPPAVRTLSDLGVRRLARDVVLVTYRAVRRDPLRGEERHTLRSSIWQRIDGRWQMVFHQGTLAAPARDAVAKS